MATPHSPPPVGPAGPLTFPCGEGVRGRGRHLACRRVSDHLPAEEVGPAQTEPEGARGEAATPGSALTPSSIGSTMARELIDGERSAAQLSPLKKKGRVARNAEPLPNGFLTVLEYHRTAPGRRKQASNFSCEKPALAHQLGERIDGGRSEKAHCRWASSNSMSTTGQYTLRLATRASMKARGRQTGRAGNSRMTRRTWPVSMKRSFTAGQVWLWKVAQWAAGHRGVLVDRHRGVLVGRAPSRPERTGRGEKLRIGGLREGRAAEQHGACAGGGEEGEGRFDA